MMGVVETAGLFGQLVLSWVAKAAGTDVTRSPSDPPRARCPLPLFLEVDRTPPVFWVCEQTDQTPGNVSVTA